MSRRYLSGNLSTGSCDRNSGILVGAVEQSNLIALQNVYNYESVSNIANTRSCVLNWLCSQEDLEAMKLPGQDEGQKQVHPKAGNRFLESEEFQNWLSMKEKRLWGTGPPGAGKTFLVSRIQHKMYEHNRNLLPGSRQSRTAFLYMHHDRQYTCEQLLGCILRQFVYDDEIEIPIAIRNKWNDYLGSATSITADGLVHLIKDMAIDCKLYLVVDAWDECSASDRNRFLGWLMELEDCLALLMTSRSTRDLDKGLEGFRRVNISANQNDIRDYLNYCINSNPRLKMFCDENLKLRRAILGTITKKSGGMFLLARLHMESLETEDMITLHHIKEKLASFSNNLADKYQDIMDRIGKQSQSRQEIAISTLAWVSHAQRPLTVDELQHALVVDVKNGLFQPDKQPIPDDILTFCCGMVMLERGAFQFVHHTATEFMRELRETDKRFINFDATISYVCAAYLCIPALEQTDDAGRNTAYEADLYDTPLEKYGAKETFMVQSVQATKYLGDKKTPERLNFNWKLRMFPLAKYAATYLGCHLRAISLITTSDALKKTIVILEERRKRKFYERLLDHARSYPPQALSQRKFSTFNTRSRSASEPNLKLIGDNSSCLNDGSKVDLPSIATSVDSRVVIASPDADMTISEELACREVTSLHLAAHLGIPWLAKNFLLNPSLVHRKDPDGHTPLSIALAARHIDTALLLLEAGATLNLFSTEGCHLLLIAAQSDSAGVLVRRILEEALHIRSQGGNFILKKLNWLWRRSITRAFYYWATIVNNFRRGWTEVTRGWREEPGKSGRAMQMTRRHDSLISTPTIAKGGSVTFVDLLPVLGTTARIPAQPPCISQERGLFRTFSEVVLPYGVYKRRNYLKLVTAAFRNDITTMKSLIETGQVTLSRSGEHHDCHLLLANLALFLAVEREEIDGVKILVEGGVDINSTDRNLRSPLHRAVERQKYKLVEFLLEMHANVDAEDDKGYTPWVLAVMNMDEDASKLLIKYGANVSSGNDMLCKAVASGNANEARFLLGQGVKPSVTTTFLWEPLHSAAENGDIRCVELLLNAGANVSPMNDTYKTPLDLAIERKQVEVEHLLRSQGAKCGTQLLKENGGSRSLR
ncbi:hypothetical protein F4805DRAFT_474388 [Annulohypoxylon moriforme]|nr:hypothetical protein F4805DRAFT_474388 [Annulohypoxylon moriforme]